MQVDGFLLEFGYLRFITVNGRMQAPLFFLVDLDVVFAGGNIPIQSMDTGKLHTKKIFLSYERNVVNNVILK